jgi:Outer membrane protein beta-barrel domain
MRAACLRGFSRAADTLLAFLLVVPHDGHRRLSPKAPSLNSPQSQHDKEIPALTAPGVSAAADSGTGVGLVLGYGFNPHWSIYGTLSGASINSSDFSRHLRTGSFRLGTRMHFLAGPHRVVPFVQAGLAGRAVNEEFSIGSRTHTVTASGAGAEFGGGLNVHFTTGFAFSGGVTWMGWQFQHVSVGRSERGC